jgi:hypothetical protein
MISSRAAPQAGQVMVDFNTISFMPDRIPLDGIGNGIVASLLQSPGTTAF